MTKLIAALLLSALLPMATAALADPSKQEEAAALSVVAKAKADAGELAIAAEMYVQAAKIDPAEFGYLYSAARCFQKAGKWAEAEKAYVDYLQSAPADHAGRSKAVSYLEEVRRIKTDEAARRKATEELEREKAKLAEERQKLEAQRQREKDAEAARKAAELKLRREQPAPAPAADSWREPVGLATGLAGAAAMLTGGVVWAIGLSNAADLSSALAQKDGNGKITGIGREDALERRSTAFTEQAVGGVLFGLGTIAAATGMYLYAGDDAPSALRVMPSGNGLAVAGRF